MVASKQSLFLFGGHDGVNHLNDLHEFNTVTNAWTEIKYEDRLPNGIRGHSANCIGNNLYIFGGYDGRNKSNELICFNLTKKNWYQPAEISGQKCLNFMNGRQRHSTNTYGINKIVIFGGFDGKSMLNDVYMIDVSALEDNVLSNQVLFYHQFSKSYFKNLKTKIFDKPGFSDIIIQVKDKKIYAHKGSL
jgi:N-acetylneuraminic acid mutarotase